jgi:hypothetical protein
LADIDREDIANTIASVSDLTIDQSRRLVDEFETVFAKPFADRLAALRFIKIVRSKNPYLYRASGIRTCEDLVRRVLQDFVSASVEGDFGKFFESVGRVVSGGVKPVGGGEVDLDIRDGDIARLYAIKSGPKGFNSSSFDKAVRDLNSAERRLRQDRVRTEKKLAFAYGRRKSSFDEGIERLSSKQFWAEISGDANFYKKLMQICAALAPLYYADMQAPYEGLLGEARELFCDGNVIDWDRVLDLVSG